MTVSLFHVWRFRHAVCIERPPADSSRGHINIEFPTCSRRRMVWSLSVAGRNGLRLLALLCLIVCGSLTARSQSLPPAENTAQVKEHLKEILSQPEFHPEASNGPLDALGRAIHERWNQVSHWVQDRWKAFQRLLNRLGPAGGHIGTAISYVFCIIAIAAGVGLIAWLVAAIIRHYLLHQRDRSAKERTAFDESEGDDVMITEPVAWLQQARKFAEAEDYRRAFRCVFLAILLLMDKEGVIEFDRSRTNGDYLRLLRRQGLNRLLEALRPLVLEFDRRWYRRDETNEADYQRILAEYERIQLLMTEETSTMHSGSIQSAAGKA